MKKQIRENFKNKNFLIVNDLIKLLKIGIKDVSHLNASKGNFCSGGTIKEVMNLILKYDKEFYLKALDYIKNLDINQNKFPEYDIKELVNKSHNSFKKQSLEMFEEITVRNRSPNLFQTMIPEIEDGMKGNLDNFNNDLELITINLCSKKSQNIKYFFKSIFLDSLKEIFCKSISWVLLTVFFIVVALLKFS